MTGTRHHATPPKPRKDGFYNITVGEDVMLALERVNADLSKGLGFELSRAQALKRLIHFYETNKGEKL